MIYRPKIKVHSEDEINYWKHLINEKRRQNKEAYTNLILDNVLENMSKDGILQTSIDENGQFLFELTDDGKKLAKQLFGEKKD